MFSPLTLRVPHSNLLANQEHRYGLEVERDQSSSSSSSSEGSSSNFDHSLAELVSFSTKPLQLTEINVAKHLVGKTYAHVLDHLAAHGSSVALGLYRPSGTQGSSMPYMCTNPHPETAIVYGDRVLALRSNQDFEL